MTTINPIGGNNQNQPVDSTFQTRMQQSLTPVASLFGETPDQLMAQLNSGNTSLSALAAQKGISPTDLANAIKSGVQSTASANGQSLSDTQLTNIANRIANHRHGGHHHGGGAGAAGAPASATDPTTGATSATSATPAASEESATTAATEELLQLLGSSGQNPAEQTII